MSSEVYTAYGAPYAHLTQILRVEFLFDHLPRRCEIFEKLGTLRSGRRYTSRVLIQKSTSITDSILGVEMSESTGDFRQHGERNPILRAFPAAMCASKPLAIDLGVNNDPPSFREYQTEPGSCAHTIYSLSRERCMVVFCDSHWSCY